MSSSPVISFFMNCDSNRIKIAGAFKEAVVKNDFEKFVDHVKPCLYCGYEADVRNVVDQAVRDCLRELIIKNVSTDVLERILQFSIEAAFKDLCTVSLPVLVLSDMFDCSTLEECETIFTFIEERVDILKKDIFFKTCKNQLLRSCNDLLRRLSRSQNTVFCGRILLFLARIFPLSERSGLNIISEFNLDNATVFSSKDDSFSELSLEKEEPMEEGEISAHHPVVIDYNLYRKFWTLQDYFRQPNTCYNRMSWRHFTSYASDILSAFSSFKLDDSNSPKWKLSEGGSMSEKAMYFAKYLTSPKLLELELSDGNFRRYVLTQFLILFQYLSSPVRFKLESYQLTDDQQLWIKQASEKVYKLLAETPPGGDEFSKNVSKILKREEYWNAWKNEGCPDFKNVEDKLDLKPIKKKRRLGDEIWEAQANKKVLVGSAELNRLWNLCPDNWESCRSPKRDFVPSLDKFFEAAIEEADPANQIENQYKKVYDSNYSWRALRLLSQKYSHFFTHSNQPSKNLPCYLESMVTKLAKERPLNQMQPELVEVKTEMSSVAGDTAEDTDDEIFHNAEDNDIKEDKSQKSAKHLVTKGTLELLAEKLQGKWKILAPKLGFQEDEIYYYENEFSGLANQGKQILIVWMEQDPDGGSFATLRTALQKSGLFNLAFPILHGVENAARAAKS